jgi:phosphoribosyl 1,2-cyclic phosphodiesterase
MSMHVTFWGTRGSSPTPGHRTRIFGGNTSCISIETGGQLFICDAGTGMRELGMRLSREGKSPIEGHLFISHSHWDHIQGFPFFIPVYVPGNTLYVYDPAGRDRRVYDLLSGQMRGDYFPVDFSSLNANILPDRLEEEGRTIGEVHVSTMMLNHPGGSFAYRFDRGDQRIVYATDNEIDTELEEITDLSQPRKVPARFVEFASGADLLIADAQYTDEEYLTKRGWGHSRASTAVDLALAAGCKQLALFHHDPMHSDAEIRQIESDARQRVQERGSELVVFAAREGLELRYG